jgi:hypothetical protein
MNVLTNEERQALANALNTSAPTTTSPQAGSTHHFMNHHASV